MAIKRALALLALLAIVGGGTAVARSVLPVHQWRIYDAETGRLVDEGGVINDRERAALAVFGPGSTLKPFVLSAAIEGGLDPRALFTCKPSSLALPADQRCWLAAGHGPVNLVRAVAHSCSAYTRWAGRYVDADRYRQRLSEFGLGERLPAKEKFRALGIEAWMGAEKGIAVTADELAKAYITVFGAQLSAGKPSRFPGRELLKQGLIECCLTGTGKQARATSPMLEIMGKTGTGHTLDGRRLGVFVGLAPAQHPTHAIVMLVREGEGSLAAQMAGERLAARMNRPDR